jgi:ribosomal silencing factor RsfS
MDTETLTKLVVDALEDMKAKDVRVLDVRGKTSVTDVMVISSGTSARHVKSQADKVIEKAKEAGGRVGACGFRRCGSAPYATANPGFLSSGKIVDH